MSVRRGSDQPKQTYTDGKEKHYTGSVLLSKLTQQSHLSSFLREVFSSIPKYLEFYSVPKYIETGTIIGDEDPKHVKLASNHNTVICNMTDLLRAVAFA